MIIDPDGQGVRALNWILGEDSELCCIDMDDKLIS